MKTKAIIISGIIVLILLLAFITNPEKEKHVNNAVEKIINEDGGDDLWILGGLVDTFLKPTLAPKIKVSNYYLFSISHISSKDKNQKLNLGFGIFGQVISLSTKEELNQFKSDNKPISKENVIGTYQFNKDNTLEVIAINMLKLKFKLDLFNGRNMGSIEGVADYSKNEATFKSKEFGLCNFKIIFEEDRATIQTLNNGFKCGFGNGIVPDKVYKKTN